MSLAPDRPPAPKLRQLSLRAGKADTVASVAARYRVSVAQVAQWNKVGSQARFKAGQQIVVFMPAE
ncbi:LysM peptidoglycan-binding domain-containing protein, partial [Roseateles sp. GG27B]